MGQKKTGRVVEIALVIAIAVMIIVAVAAALSFRRRALQVRTFADMQVISRKITAHLQTGDRSREALEALVRSVNQGKDAWGNDFVLQIRDTDQGYSYLLISPGSDGRLDVASAAAYFDLERVDIRRQYANDLVFRDGVAVTMAGK
jgi:hypothetical protein